MGPDGHEVSPYARGTYDHVRCGVCGVPWGTHAVESPGCVGREPAGTLTVETSYDADRDRTVGRAVTPWQAPGTVEEIPEVPIGAGLLDHDDRMPLHLLLIATGLADSSAQARRVIEQGGVVVDTRLETDPFAAVLVDDGTVVRVGKTRKAVLRVVEAGGKAAGGWKHRTIREALGLDSPS